MRPCRHPHCENEARPDRSECNSCSKRRLRIAKSDSREHEDTSRVPPGFAIKGTSVLTKTAAGEPIWVKTTREAQRFAEVEAALERFEERAGMVTAASPVRPPAVDVRDMLAVALMGDPHIGMLSWAEETGAHFDLQIATRDLHTAFGYLVRRAPAMDQCLIINAGDFFHADSNSAATTRGTEVDRDSRQAKVIDYGIAAMVAGIDTCLSKFGHVTVWTLIGNHDTYSALWLARLLKAWYRNEPRVTIDTNPGRANFYRFGNCLIAGTHGDTLKWKDLPGVMICDRARDMGQTRYRHWYTGHVHHESVKELPGMTVETLRTLAPQDAWHAAQGYRAMQDMRMDFWDRTWGRLDRSHVPLELIRHIQQSGGSSE